MKLIALALFTMSFSYNSFAFEVGETSRCTDGLIRFIEAFPEDVVDGLNVTTLTNHDKDQKTLVVFYAETKDGLRAILDCEEISISEEN